MRETEYEKGRGNAIENVRYCLERILAADRHILEEPPELFALFTEVSRAVLLMQAVRMAIKQTNTPEDK